MCHIINFITTNYIRIALIFVGLYCINIIVKLMYCHIRKCYGKHLDQEIYRNSNCRDSLNRLYPQLESYCNSAGIELLPKIYKLYNSQNLLNGVIQKTMHTSINRAIGVYSKRQRYCYILFTIKNDNKSTSVRKTLLDALIKLTVAFLEVAVQFLGNMNR